MKEKPTNIYKSYFQKLSALLTDSKKTATSSLKEEKNFDDKIASINLSQKKVNEPTSKSVLQETEKKALSFPSGVLSSQDFNLNFLDD